MEFSPTRHLPFIFQTDHVAMTLTLTPEVILELLRTKGEIAYAGEPINQIEHAWQCGQLARNAGVSEALQLASWLHDIGHLMTDLTGSPTERGIDDVHELLGADLLFRLWGAPVAEPVRLHVAAKRYLVATQPAYRESLSADSERSLVLQGGPMSAEECLQFESSEYALAARQLRSWDDIGKKAGWFAPTADQALEELAALMGRVGRAG